MSLGRVRVAVRVRPLNEKEQGPAVVTCSDPTTIELLCPSAGGVNQVKSYAFDQCADEGFDQKDVFQHCGAAKLMDAACEGMKVTILAYVSRPLTFWRANCDRARRAGSYGFGQDVRLCRVTTIIARSVP